MKPVKCAWCKEQSNKQEMQREEIIKKDKEGKEKITNKYYHHSCYELYAEDKQFKKIEFGKWDKLFQYLVKVHNIEVLDGRMIKKLQDLRNGTIELNGYKNKKYKQGVDYDLIFHAYQYAESSIQWVIKNKSFDTKYKEFAYCFSVMESKINDVSNQSKLNKKQEEELVKVTKSLKDIDATDMQDIATPKRKKDNLDISNFL